MKDKEVNRPMAGHNDCSVKRIYVEKKKDFAVEALNLAEELKSFLKIKGIKDLRILHRYDVEGLSEEIFKRSAYEIMSSPGLDDVYDELPAYDYIVPIGLLHGQFDQRADSCAENIRLINDGEKPKVEYARLILIKGTLNHEEINKIESYLINPVESRKVSLDLPAELGKFDEDADEVPIIEGFIELNDDGADDFLQTHNLAMDRADLLFCRDYFRSENRNPSVTELKMIDTYWSDHCRHTTFLTEIDETEILDSDVKATYAEYLQIKDILGRSHKPVTLMDLATIGARYLKHKGLLTDQDESPEVNACSVRIDVDVDGQKEPWLLMFKNETHNHPTEIEPFGGAATCLGGAIRDPLSGRAYVYQAMRVTGAKNPLLDFEETLPGKLPQRTIAKQAAAGYSSYGNQIGVPAGLVREIYHPGYEAKRMEMGAVIAAAPARQVVRKEPEEGDLVILLGGKTGRDGLGAATGSSKSHDASSLEKSGPQVQKGNAPEESKIQRLFRNPRLSELIKRCNDFGAGGVSVAVGELADSLHIDLDKVPLKYPGLDGTEIAISESQERMAVVISQSDLNTFMNYANAENLEATVIAEITSTGRLVMNFRGKKVVDISRDFLNSNGTAKHTKVKVPAMGETTTKAENSSDFKEGFGNMVHDLNHCSQKGLSEIFDFSAGGNCVLAPFGGYFEETPIQAMASKIPVMRGETSACSLAAFGFDPYLSESNPFKGAYTAVIHSVGKLLATGGNIDKCWLSFQEYFERLGSDPEKWGKPFSALLGALKAQIDLGLAAIGGKDSMSGSFEDIHVPPTLISVAVSLGEAGEIISPEFKAPGNPVVYMRSDDLFGNDEDGPGILSFYREIRSLIKGKKVLSAYALSAAGIGEAVFEMSLGNRIGLEIADNFNEPFFEAGYGSFILELDPSKFTGEADYPGILLGHTIDDFGIKAENGNLLVDFLPVREKYIGKLHTVYPTATSKVNDKTGHPVQPSLFAKNNSYKKMLNHEKAKPVFLIPVVPGNQGEYELSRKIEEAGGRADIFVFKNRDRQAISTSLQELADKISTSQGLVLPGGMPLGNEPDGGGKYVASILRQPIVAQAVERLLNDKKGLILGLGSGFEALMRAGLLPQGHIIPSDTHYCGFQDVKICSTDTPWFFGLEVGDIYKMPLSWAGSYLHFDDSDVRIVAKFMSGSAEAIVSPCGKIIGRIGNFERTGNNFCKNIPGLQNINIFHSAMRYFD